MPTLAPGDRLGPYEVVGTLGAGGMGEVYRATDTRLDRTVAVKVLTAHVADSPEQRERLKRELQWIDPTGEVRSRQSPSRSRGHATRPHPVCDTLQPTWVIQSRYVLHTSSPRG